MDNSLYIVQKRKFIITEYGAEQLKQKYNLGCSQNQIAKEFKVSEDTVRRWMRELGIEIRKRKYILNENYFESITTPEQAYWLGFLSADGYVNTAQGELELELQEQDQEHLQKFVQAISCTKPLMKIRCGDKQQFTHYRFVIRCKRMVMDLSHYNIIQNKSLVFYPINIPESLFDYWILGYMDGDGCILQSKNRLKINFTGTNETLSILKDYFESNNIISKAHRCINNTYSFTLEVAKSEQFLARMNYQELSFVLARKQKRYSSFIQQCIIDRT